MDCVGLGSELYAPSYANTAGLINWYLSHRRTSSSFIPRHQLPEDEYDHYKNVVLLYCWWSISQFCQVPFFHYAPSPSLLTSVNLANDFSVVVIWQSFFLPTMFSQFHRENRKRAHREYFLCVCKKTFCQMMPHVNLLYLYLKSAVYYLYLNKSAEYNHSDQ